MAKRKKRRKYQQAEYYSLSPEAKKGVIIISLFAASVIFILSFLDAAGIVGSYIDEYLGIAFGWGRFFIPIIFILLGYVLARPSKYEVSITNYIGLFLMMASFHGLLHLKLPVERALDFAFDGMGGGLLGFGINYFLVMYLGKIATLFLLIAIFATAIILTFNASIETILEKTNIFKRLSPLFKKQNSEDEDDEEDYEEDEDEEDEEPQTEKVRHFGREILAKEKSDSHPQIKTSKIRIDLPLSLLDDKASKPLSGDIEAGKEKIQHTLENFNIKVEMSDVKVGPTVTQYTLKPSEGIKLSRITALGNDLALALAAHPIRIEAPIPGKSLVGIEVPNQKPAVVRIREILESKSFKKRGGNMELALGKDVSGKCWTDNLAKMPHMLVAGSTGSGKSVCLNGIILSLLYQNNPDSLRLIMVDPKRVEFPIYNGIPHLLAPVITDVTKTVYALRWAITEMDRRFDTLSKVNKRDIASYNATSKEKMPYLVIVIDELADLMVAAAAEVESSIIRLTQMARAVGIHLIVATQRPSVDVITGLIKANIPARVAFSVASLMDSRTILDSSGAEKLVGKGDMLFMTPATATPRRLQGAFVSDEEINRVVNFLKKASPDPEYNDEITNKTTGSTSFDFKSGKGGGGEDGDELFDEAREIVIKAGKASASLLQRRLRVGYARAARLIDLLEDSGIVGPAEGAKPREILVDKVAALTNSEPKPEKSFQPAEKTYEEEDDDDDEAENSHSPLSDDDDDLEEVLNDDEFEDEDDDDKEEEIEQAEIEEAKTSSKKSKDNEIY